MVESCTQLPMLLIPPLQHHSRNTRSAWQGHSIDLSSLRSVPRSPQAPLPDLWPLFEGLKPFPVLIIRGEHSDLLSTETVQAMQDRHPRLTAITVPGQGHAPALDGDLTQTIKQFVSSMEKQT